VQEIRAGISEMQSNQVEFEGSGCIAVTNDISVNTRANRQLIPRAKLVTDAGTIVTSYIGSYQNTLMCLLD
jgi:hypothetical protein